MRVRGLMLATMILGFLAVGLATGQPGPFPFGGGPGGGDLTSLIRNPGVRKELNLTDEQAAKIPDALLKALEGVLDKDQMKRLRQIELQQRGPRAFAEAKVQETLKFTEDQKDKVKTILDEIGMEMREIFKAAKGGDFKGIREKTETLQKEASEKLTGVLSAEQKRAWKQLLGEEFKMERFGGFRPDAKKGEFKKKRGDTDK